jgi:hypothetical protein
VRSKKVRRAVPGEVLGKGVTRLQVLIGTLPATRAFFSNWDDDAREYLIDKLVYGTLDLVAGLDDPASCLSMVDDEQVFMSRKVIGDPDETTFLTTYNPTTQVAVIYLEGELPRAAIH